MAGRMDAQQVLQLMSDVETEPESVSDSANSEDSVVEESGSDSEHDSGQSESMSSDDDSESPGDVGSTSRSRSRPRPRGRGCGRGRGRGRGSGRGRGRRGIGRRGRTQPRVTGRQNRDLYTWRTVTEGKTGYE